MLKLTSVVDVPLVLDPTVGWDTSILSYFNISKKARSIQGPIGADGLIQCSHGLAGPDRAMHDLAYT